MTIYIGADHRGFPLKEALKPWILNQGYEVIDVGAKILEPNDDYPTYARSVAQKVFEGDGARGIVICGSGVGVDIVANKFEGIRSGLGINAEQVTQARRDDDINILAIAADQTDKEEAEGMLKAFLETAFVPSQKHTRRLEEIKEIEKENF